MSRATLHFVAGCGHVSPLNNLDTQPRSELGVRLIEWHFVECDSASLVGGSVDYTLCHRVGADAGHPLGYERAVGVELVGGDLPDRGEIYVGPHQASWRT